MKQEELDALRIVMRNREVDAVHMNATRRELGVPFYEMSASVESGDPWLILYRAAAHVREDRDAFAVLVDARLVQ